MSAGPADVDEILLRRLHPYANPGAISLRRVLRAALAYSRTTGGTDQVTLSLEQAEIPTGEALVLDERALFMGVVADGRRSRTKLSTSVWLVEWLRREGIGFDLLSDPPPADAEQRAAEIAAGRPIVLSPMLEARILPAALELAKATVSREKVDLRHMLFALLDEPDAEGMLLEWKLTPDRLQRLKLWLVERITSHPERTEKVEAWQDFVREDTTNTIPREHVRTYSDAPAIVDRLGRRAFAEVLAQRIRDIAGVPTAPGPLSSVYEDRAFMLHLHGPWGSGKSSILNLLKMELEREPSWLVVEYNAWRNHDRSPAWWPLVAKVRDTAIGRLSWTHAPKLWWIWLSWRLRMDWGPILLTLVLVFLALWVVLSRNASPGTVLGMQEVIEAVVAILAAAGALLAASRTILLGSTRTAEQYLQSKSDPHRSVIRLFNRLVAAVPRPVVVFVDDLDRCESRYVTELLESIQVMLRSAPIVYVVAGDRKWICSSFEKRYEDFRQEIGGLGRPLGYLFLDKVFQLSVLVPQLSGARKQSFWETLLKHDRSSDTSDDRDNAELEAVAQLQGKTTHEAISEVIASAKVGSLEREALESAAAKQITSAPARSASEHRLQKFAHLLEPNPRSMKRLINAYGLNQARVYLEGRNVDADALARWTILELRWPLLADALSHDPSILEHLRNLDPKAPKLEESVRGCCGDRQIVAVLGEEGEPGHLTDGKIRAIFG